MRYHRDPHWAFKSVLDGSAGILVPLIASEADLGALFQLNSTGAFLWAALDIPREEEELLTALRASFDTDQIPDAELRRELREHLREMTDLGALKPNPG